jgi:predicted RNase H-like HicB family nuclease
MRQRFLVVYEHGKSGYSGYVPDWPGYVSSAATLEEMQKRMRKTVKLYLDALTSEAKQIPQQTTTTIEFPRPVEGTEAKHWVVERLEINLGAPRKSRNAMTA